jgi:hypothetical protein
MEMVRPQGQTIFHARDSRSMDSRQLFGSVAIASR